MLNNIIDRSRIINPSVQQSQQTIMIHLPPRESYNWPTQQLWQQQQQQQKTLQKLPLHSSSIPMHNSKAISASGQYTTKSSDQFNKSAVRGVPVAVPITKRYGSISGYYKSGSIQQPVGGIRGLQGRTSDPCAGCPPDGGSDSFGAIGNLIKEQLDLVPYMIYFFTYVIYLCLTYYSNVVDG